MCSIFPYQNDLLGCSFKYSRTLQKNSSPISTNSRSFQGESHFQGVFKDLAVFPGPCKPCKKLKYHCRWCLLLHAWTKLRVRVIYHSVNVNQCWKGKVQRTLKRDHQQCSDFSFFLSCLLAIIWYKKVANYFVYLFIFISKGFDIHRQVKINDNNERRFGVVMTPFSSSKMKRINCQKKFA